MATTTVTFDGVLSKMNQSLQIGDILYYGVVPAGSGAFFTEFQNKTTNSIFKLGTVKNIHVNPGENYTEITAQQPSYINPPPNNSFIFFSKDNTVNVNSIKGYYGQMNFVNNSFEPAELYAVSCDVTESSK